MTESFSGLVVGLDGVAEDAVQFDVVVESRWCVWKCEQQRSMSHGHFPVTSHHFYYIGFYNILGSSDARALTHQTYSHGQKHKTIDLCFLFC